MKPLDVKHEYSDDDTDDTDDTPLPCEQQH